LCGRTKNAPPGNGIQGGTGSNRPKRASPWSRTVSIHAPAQGATQLILPGPLNMDERTLPLAIEQMLQGRDGQEFVFQIHMSDSAHGARRRGSQEKQVTGIGSVFPEFAHA
jgi:hypothetical protein